jgi:hypothetical protein
MRHYWLCPHIHRNGDEALACAREHLRTGLWNGQFRR